MTESQTAPNKPDIQARGRWWRYDRAAVTGEGGEIDFAQLATDEILLYPVNIYRELP